MERKSNVDAFGLGPFGSVFLEGIDPWISVFDGSYWLKWVKIRLWLAHWPWLAWQRRWGGWRRGRGPCESTPFFRRCCTRNPRPGSSPARSLRSSVFCEEGSSILAGFFSFPRIAKYNTCFFVVILACSRACCSSFFCVECFRGIVAQRPPFPAMFRDFYSLLFFFWNSKLRFQVLKAGGGECGVSNSSLALLCCAGSCTTVIRYLSLSSISQSSWKVLLSCTRLSYLSPACISQSS